MNSGPRKARAPKDPLTRDDPLARRAQAWLSMPPRHAPAALETRVLQALRQRAALPWWRRAPAQWPDIARAPALMALTVAAALAFAFIRRVVTPGPFQEPTWLQTALHPLHVPELALILAGTGASLAHDIPLPWLYGALTFGAMLYAALFGLGATAYRMLYNRSLTRPP